MKIIKKNQLTILVIALMLVTAGYLNYNTNQSITTEGKVASIGDATLVSSDSVISNSTTNALVDNENTKENNLNTENVITTNSKIENKNHEGTNYYVSSRLERDTMYSQMLEAYQKILDSTTTTEKQKIEAQKEITSINNTKNAIMISENLIKTKGFEECLIYVNDNSINIVVNKNELTKEDTAQIQNIIAREMNGKLENIHITTK